MAAPRVMKHEPSLLEDLRYAVHGLYAPFVCGGTLVPNQPLTLCFRDKTQLPVLRVPRVFEQEQLLQPLLQRCTPAPSARGVRPATIAASVTPSSSRLRVAPSPS